MLESAPNPLILVLIVVVAVVAGEWLYRNFPSFGPSEYYVEAEYNEYDCCNDDVEYVEEV